MSTRGSTSKSLPMLPEINMRTARWVFVESLLRKDHVIQNSAHRTAGSHNPRMIWINQSPGISCVNSSTEDFCTAAMGAEKGDNGPDYQQNTNTFTFRDGERRRDFTLKSKPENLNVLWTRNSKMILWLHNTFIFNQLCQHGSLQNILKKRKKENKITTNTS